MITLDNLKDVLTALNFVANDDVWTKKFANNAYLKVDFDKKKLIYPEDLGLEVNERQTCNFNAPENFVVFECVHRLLEKGYLPEHIILEPKWKVGHGASGGRADILVKNYENTPILIIECKTFGREFDKAWKETTNDGGQLFSYVEQEKSVNYVCLYASTIENHNIVVHQRIISVKDNKKLVADNPNAISYEKATNVKERYKVWKEIYHLEYTEKGIFESNILPYQIGKNKYTLEIDTSPITSFDMRGKYHDFRTILRSHAVSRRENAFEVLVNLFLCKIVDEKNNPEDLKFYWKGVAYDSYFDLVDRLQSLYHQGMKDYLNQDIVYISEQDIKDRFWAVKNHDNPTEREIIKLFRQLKYFKGLDFDFIKVTNQPNFEKNAKILIEVIQMWQNLRLTSTDHNQFLGDMFEYFLDNGVKQSEGQFFTPIPICKFIVSSLPLEQFLENETPPKVIDYACGSGHFLTEYADQITQLIQTQKADKDILPYYQNIYGIEKEDRLAKVAKVATFMHSRPNINIFDADALIPHANINNESFDILIANPPFAVEDFLSNIDEEHRNKFTLMNKVDNLGNKQIQCFFLERTWQLMNAGGMVGVIVPSSILNTSDGIHIETRAILLKYFDFISIVELGSNTFGKTGTNTVILFLKRKSEKPEQFEQFNARIDGFFNDYGEAVHQGDIAYQDNGIIQEYCQYQEIDVELYQAFLQGELKHDLFSHELFHLYRNEFDNSTEVKNKKKTKTFEALSIEEQKAQLDKMLLNFIKEKEREKLKYFTLAKHNAKKDNIAQKVLIIKSPSDNTAQKAFLGYEWSNAKNSEGISYRGGNTVYDIQTPMFDPKNRLNPNKLSYLIHQQFLGNTVTVPNELNAFVSYSSLTEMLDFGRVDFDKAIRTSIQKKIEIQSKYPLKDLGLLLAKIQGNTTKIEKRDILENGKYPVITQETDRVVSGYTNNENAITDLPLIVFGDHSCTFKYIDFPFIRGADGTQLLKFTESELKSKYVFYYLQGIKIENYEKYERHFKYLKNTKIPLPPLDIQEQIIKECQAIDNEYETSRMSIETYREKIAKIFNDLEIISGGVKRFKISELCLTNPSKSEIRQLADDLIVSFIEMSSVSNHGYIEHKVDKLLGEVRKGSYTYFAENDVIIAKITPCMENGKCALATGLTNGIALGSSEFHVFRSKSDELNPKFLFYFLNRESIRKEAEKNMTGASGHRRVPIGFYESLIVPLPEPTEQQKIITQIEQYEQEIQKAEMVMSGIAERKKAVLATYL